MGSMTAAAPKCAEIEFPAIIDGAADPAWDLGTYAQHAVLKHFRRVLDQREVVWANDGPDGVHDIRVATRRCRTAMQTFSSLWDAPEVKRLARRMGAFAKAFGPARDMDVIIIYLQDKLAQNSGSPDPAAKWLLARNIELRLAGQPRVEAALLDFECEELPAQIVDYFSRHPHDLWSREAPDG